MATLKDFIATPAAQGARSVMPGERQMPQQPTLKDLLTYKDPKTWQKILGVIGDGLQIAGGGRASYTPTIQAMRQHDADIQQEWNLAELKGQQDVNRFKAQEDYKRANPAPTELERYMAGAGIDPNSEQGQSMFRSKAENTANPPVWRQGPDMQFYRVDTPGGAPTKPVGRLTPIAEAAPTASQYTPQPDVVKRAYIDMYGPQRGAQMYDELIGGR